MREESENVLGKIGKELAFFVQIESSIHPCQCKTWGLWSGGFPMQLLGGAQGMSDYTFGRTDLGHDDILIADFIVWARIIIEDDRNGDVRSAANII